jgi:protein-S-isoprenylcysteine O-methyltransferase Ste14
MLFLQNLLFTILVPGTVAVYMPLLITRGKAISMIPILLVVGIIFLVIGISIYSWTVWEFATFGRGTTLPIDPPKRLVVKGVYRYTRNPMYLGVMLVILGWAVLYAEWQIMIYAIGVGIVIHLFVVLYEEPKLTELFWDDYTTYRQSVGRWSPRIPNKGS